MPLGAARTSGLVEQAGAFANVSEGDVLRVLYLLPYAPVPSDVGNKHLTSNLLKYMSRHARVDVAMMLDDAGQAQLAESAMREAFPELGEIKCVGKPSGFQLMWRRLRWLISGMHHALGRYDSSLLAGWLKRQTMTGRWDVVHFDMIHMAPYIRYCRHAKTVLVASDAYSLAAKNAREMEPSFWRRLRLDIESFLLRRVETSLYACFDEVCSVSPVDAAYLSRQLGGKAVRHIGIAVGEEFLRLPPRAFPGNDATGGYPAILCTGSLSNRSVAADVLAFLQHGLPVIRQSHGDVRCVVWGRDPVDFLQEFIAGHPDIGHVDFVDDYVGFLNHDWIYAYPQRCGTGLQTKVQQAMVLGLPVVGFQIAFSALGLGKDVERSGLCASHKEMGDRILQFYRSEALRRDVGERGAALIREAFSIEGCGRRMLGFYDGNP